MTSFKRKFSYKNINNDKHNIIFNIFILFNNFNNIKLIFKSFFNFNYFHILFSEPKINLIYVFKLDSFESK